MSIDEKPYEPELGQIAFGAPNVGEFDARWATDGLRLIADSLPDMWSDFENDVFSFHPHWWGENEEAPEAGRPNFYHKKSGVAISWYKYIGRGMSGCRKPLNWDSIVKECVESLKSQTDNGER